MKSRLQWRGLQVEEAESGYTQGTPHMTDAQNIPAASLARLLQPAPPAPLSQGTQNQPHCTEQTQTFQQLWFAVAPSAPS